MSNGNNMYSVRASSSVNSATRDVGVRALSDSTAMLLWVAALLTLVTGYDYLRAGLPHMSRAPRSAHGKTQHLA